MASITSPAQIVAGAGNGQPSAYPFPITPSDVAELRYVTRSIRVGGAGDLAVRTPSGEVAIIPSCLAGEWVAVVADKVFATGTTATELTGFA